jgi:hypothetical protein
MSDEPREAPSIANAITARVMKKTAVLVGAAVLGALVYSWVGAPSSASVWSLPAGVLVGGVLGFVNFRWLATAVERVYLRKGATPGVSSFAAVVIGVLKLSAIFIVLFVIIKWRLLPVLGFVAGLTLFFLAILWEGVTVMRKNLASGG